MRIDKFLSDCTPMGRKEIRQIVKKGQVSCNGKVITDPGAHIDEKSDEITLNGDLVRYVKYVYLMLNKPDGYVSATYDKHYPVVTELVPEVYRHYEVFPVGRLDIDTHGLLLLTNDGDLAHTLLSPKSHVPKTYYVKSEKAIGDSEKEAFRLGMDLGDFTSLPAECEVLSEDGRESLLTIFEGKFHQVKRMYEKVDNKVLYLKRISMGSLELDKSLDEGSVRELTVSELEKLMNM